MPRRSLIRQATVQLMVTCGVLAVSAICTALTAFFNINTPTSNPYTILPDKDLPQEDPRPNQTLDTQKEHKEYHTHETQSDDTGIDISDKNSNTSSKFDDSDKRGEYFDPLLDKDYVSESENVGQKLCNGKNLEDDSGTDQLILSPNSCRETSDDVAEENSLCWRWFGWRKHKANFITAFICGYLSCSSLYPYNIYATDFLGKVVMGGVPTAPHDSAEFQAYSEGVAVGAKGLLVAYCFYLFFSTVHGKLLSVLGLKMDFCLSLLLLAMAELALLLLEHVAAYYVCCAVYSFVRTTFYSVPFIIATSYVYEQEKTGTPASGRTMAVLTCMLPLSMVTIFTLSGPLVSLTHYPGAPLFLSAFTASLGSFIFFIMYTP